MLTKYLWVFFVSMVPLVELRGSIYYFAGTAAAGTFFLYCGNYRKYAAGAGDLSVCTESSGMGSG